ncbi:MAG TPA: leucine--tRNA ligase, partial [Anaerolineales bacterium]
MPTQQTEIHWPDYDPQVIEPKWQQLWEQDGLYLAHDSGDDRPKFYCLDFFPYPSGEGLHVGHCRNYFPTDVLARFKRMQGYNVLHPMGWDAFGEPAEQFAVAHGVHPRVTTAQNTANFRRQMTLIGVGYDWSREITSSDAEFYRWTQWFFLLLYKRGLAYRDTHYQWWCPVCQTTLSSHEVTDGVCWRGHSGVTQREIPAWYFKITAYADQLLAGLDEIDWPEKIKTMQRTWIGRSQGVEVSFRLDDRPRELDQDPVFAAPAEDPQTYLNLFTTRLDTLFGVTFIVMAPEHPLVDALTSPEQRGRVDAYRAESSRQSEVTRMEENREKTGVFTGGYAIHPLSGERIPVWIADYVLPGYGTGAVMGVPAHDARDFEFAEKYDLPIRRVILTAKQAPGQTEDRPFEADTDEGIMVHSGPFDGLDSSEGREAVYAALGQRGLGQKAVHYRMHDWLISRQRYWGTPIPIVYCDTCGEVPVPEDQLPVLLPPMDDFQPDGSGRSPLA